MSAELNRRVAELSGWRCVQVETETVTICKSPNSGTVKVYPGAYVIFNPGGEALWTEGNIRNPEEAWDYATRYLLPDYSGDPSAALALLAGHRLLWGATAHNDYGDGTWIEFSVAKGGKAYWSEVEVVNGDEARAFAEAAAEAWCQWKEAGE